MPPTSEQDRLPLLDALRGLALMGILVINVRYLAQPMRVVFGGFPPVGETGRWNLLAHALGDLLCEDRMIALFSTLFGAGVALACGRGGGGRQLRSLWRNLLLLGIGALHAHLLWHGDVLMVYGVCGMLLVLLQAWRWPSGVQLALGLALCLAAPLHRSLPEDLRTLTGHGSAVVEGTGSLAPPGLGERTRAGWERVLEREAPTHAAPEEPLTLAGRWRAYRDLVRWRVEVNTWWQVVGAPFNLLRCGGLMLVGMALLHLGILGGAARASTYATLLALAGMLTLVLTWMQLRAPLIDLVTGVEVPREVRQARGGLQRSAGYLAALTGMLAWVGLVGWILRSALLLRLSWPLRALGRTALTAYLTHSLVFTFVMHPFGLGLWGELDVLGQLRWVGAVLAAQLVLAPLWLHVFRFGPAEWLWRSATYGRWQPLLRGRGPTAGAGED